MVAPSSLYTAEARFNASFRNLPRDVALEVIMRFSLRELLIMAESGELAAIAYAELENRYRALMKKFRLPVTETRAMLEDEDSVISGSGALHICAPGPFVPTDIDFYCPYGRREAVVAFLVANGYDVVAKQDGNGSPLPLDTAQAGDSMEEEVETDDGTASGGEESGGLESGGLESGGEESGGEESGGEESGGEENGGEKSDGEEGGSGGHADQEPTMENLYSKHVMKEVVLLQKGEDGPMLNVIESILPCAEAPVFCFHSTVVMNVVTSKGAISYYPQWTMKKEGVVNRPSGLNIPNRKEKKKDKEALGKYRRRGYTLHEDCEVLHMPGEKYCDACKETMKSWDEGMMMTFQPGVEFTPSGRMFAWHLGQQEREKKKMFWKDQGAAIVVQGDGDERVYVYDGKSKKTWSVGRRELLGVL